MSGSVIPRIEIRLPSGLLLRDPVAMLAAKFGQWPWDRYDGLPLADPNADVDAAFNIRERNNVNRAEFRQRVADVRAVRGTARVTRATAHLRRTGYWELPGSRPVPQKVPERSGSPVSSGHPHPPGQH